MKFTLAKFTLVTFVAAGMMAPASNAASVGLYTFDGSSPNASGVAPNLTFSPFSASSNVGIPSAGGRYPSGNPSTGKAFSADSWSNTFDSSKYFEFAITPQSGYSITLNALSLDSDRSNTGPQKGILRSSLDNYISSVSNFDIPTTFASQSTSLNAAFTNLSSPVTFRIYGYNASSAAGTWRVDNVQVSGSVATPVPFEFSPTLGLLALGVWGTVAQIRRNKGNN